MTINDASLILTPLSSSIAAGKKTFLLMVDIEVNHTRMTLKSIPALGQLGICKHLFASQVFARQVFASYLFARQVFASQLFTSQLFGSQLFFSQLYLIASYLLSRCLLARYLLARYLIATYLLASYLLASNLLASYIVSQVFASKLFASQLFASQLLAFATQLFASSPAQCALLPNDFAKSMQIQLEFSRSIHQASELLLGNSQLAIFQQSSVTRFTDKQFCKMNGDLATGLQIHLP